MINGEVKKTLWAAADKLRSNMDAADRDRSGEVLFIDARKLGRLETASFESSMTTRSLESQTSITPGARTAKRKRGTPTFRASAERQS